MLRIMSGVGVVVPTKKPSKTKLKHNSIKKVRKHTSSIKIRVGKRIGKVDRTNLETLGNRRIECLPPGMTWHASLGASQNRIHKGYACAQTRFDHGGHGVTSDDQCQPKSTKALTKEANQRRLTFKITY